MPGPYTVPFIFIPGTTIFSSQVNTNFTSGNNNLNIHEASNSGVHGITGNFVDTGSIQTITAAKTFSAGVTFNGIINYNNTLKVINGNLLSFYTDAGVTLGGSINAVAGPNLEISTGSGSIKLVPFNGWTEVRTTDAISFDGATHANYIQSDGAHLTAVANGGSGPFVVSSNELAININTPLIWQGGGASINYDGTNVIYTAATGLHNFQQEITLPNLSDPSAINNISTRCVAKAWGSFSGAGTLIEGFNINGNATHPGAGDYIVETTVNLSNTNYAPLACLNVTGFLGFSAQARVINNHAVEVYSSSGGGPQDHPFSVVIFGF